MKIIVTALVLIGAMFSSAAMAQSTKGLMFGGMVGFAKPHGSNSDSALTIGGRLGQPIQGGVSWEADANLGINDGKYGTDQSYSINSIAGYGGVRTEGDIH